MKPDRTDSARPAFSLDDLVGPSPTLWRDGRDIGREDLLAAAAALVPRLGEACWIANYCVDRQSFVVTWLAGMMSGTPILLPPDRTAATFAALARDYPGLCAAMDRVMDLPAERAIMVDDAAAPPAAIPVERALRDDDLVAVMFTSGSTGYPKPWRKTLAMLRAQMEAYFEPFGVDRGAPASLVATVPQHHMYGLESTILTSLFTALACHSGMPQFAADVIAALATMAPPRILITTPAHLHGLVRHTGPAPAIHRIISATAPLDPDLAGAAEDRFATTLIEVFGATEVGLIATRRPAREEVWRTPGHISIEARGGEALVHADYLGEAVPLGDELEVIDGRRFLFKGRKQDNVNIAGKRTSLSGLDRMLRRIEGVEDGAFFLPADGGGRIARRVVVFAVAPRWSEQSLKREIRKRVDPAFVPKRVHLLDRLPRNNVGKLSYTALSDLTEALA